MASRAQEGTRCLPALARPKRRDPASQWDAPAGVPARPARGRERTSGPEATEASFGVVVTTGKFALGSETLADCKGIEFVDDDRFAGLLAEHGIPISEPANRDLADLVEELVNYWSETLATTAHEVAETIDSTGDFESGLSRSDYSTDLDVIPVGETVPATKLLFSSVGLRLYARRGGWERVVGVSAHDEHVPSNL